MRGSNPQHMHMHMHMDMDMGMDMDMAASGGCCCIAADGMRSNGATRRPSSQSCWRMRAA